MNTESILPPIYDQKPTLSKNGIQEFQMHSVLTQEHFAKKVDVHSDRIITEEFDNLHRKFRAKFADLQQAYSGPGIRLHFFVARQYRKWKPSGIHLAMHFIVFKTNKGSL